MGRDDVRDDSGDVCAVQHRLAGHGLHRVPVRRGGVPGCRGARPRPRLELVALRTARARRDDEGPGGARPRGTLLRRCLAGRRRIAGMEPAAALASGASSAAAFVAAPWFVWMYARFGDAFVQGYILAGNLYYVTQPASFSGRAVSHTFYVRAFAGGFFPWSAIAMARLADLALRRRSTAVVSIDEKLLWLWTAVVIALFSVARFKLDHYIFPVAPAVCLIAARAWQEAALPERGRAWITQHGRVRAGRRVRARRQLRQPCRCSSSISSCRRPRSCCRLRWASAASRFSRRSPRAGWRVPRSPHRAGRHAARDLRHRRGHRLSDARAHPADEPPGARAVQAHAARRARGHLPAGAVAGEPALLRAAAAGRAVRRPRTSSGSSRRTGRCT